MDGNQEFTPTPEGEQSQTTQKPLEEPEVVKQPTRPSFTAKLSEIRASSKANLQRLNILLSGESTEQTQTEKTPSIDARSLLEELAKAEDLSPSEYLRRSTAALGGAARLRQQVDAERETLERSIREHGSTWQIERRLEELNRLRGFGKIPAVLERRRLNKQKTSIQNEVDELSSQAQGKRELLTQIQAQETPVKQKQEEMLLAEISQAVQGVKSGYEQLLQEVVQDGTIPTEIRNAYIRRYIEPRLQEIVKNKELTTDKKDEFFQALNAYLDHRNSPEEERQPYEAALNEWLYKDGFYYVRDDCQALVNARDTQMVQRLAASLAAEDIAPIRALAEPHYSGWEASRRFSRAFESAIEPTDEWGWNRNANSFGNQIVSALNKPSDESYPDMRFWEVVKDSPAATELFGDLIKSVDDRTFATALEKSLSDREGQDIDMLAYYPRPEAIRNLVILAAADYSPYRTVHANGALTSLARRSNWSEILDQAEQAYPALKTARPFLEHWNHGEQSNNPGVQEAVGDFALDIFVSKPLSRLTGLAAESLTNGSILTLLAKRGILSEQEEATLREADTLSSTLFFRQLFSLSVNAFRIVS